MTQVIYETKRLISIYHLSIARHLKWFPKCIESYWLMVSKAEKKNDFQKLKRGGFPWIFIEPKESLQVVFHDLWAQKQQIVLHGNWFLALESVSMNWCSLQIQISSKEGQHPCMYHLSFHQFELWHLPCAEGCGISNHTQIGVMARG